MIRVVCVVSACFLGGCASIIEGTSQQILVNTNPAGAQCGLYRKGIKIGTIAQAPGSTLVDKTKTNIWVVCMKQGYQAATYLDKSGIAPGTFGNIVAGGGIGWAIDSASGADNKYDSPINLSMVPAAPGAPSVAPQLPATFDGTLPPA